MLFLITKVSQEFRGVIRTWGHRPTQVFSEAATPGHRDPEAGGSDMPWVPQEYRPRYTILKDDEFPEVSRTGPPASKNQGSGRMSKSARKRWRMGNKQRRQQITASEAAAEGNNAENPDEAKDSDEAAREG